MGEKKIFISYSHADEEWKDRLVKQLKVLQLEGFYDLWDDRRIHVGDDWKPEIDNALARTHVAIMMISADFLTSNFIRSVEVPEILKRRNEKTLRVIPVIIKPCQWEKIDWLSKIQAHPRDGEPLIKYKNDEYQLETRLSQLAGIIADLLNDPNAPKPPSGDGQSSRGPDKVSLGKLPITSGNLFGREKELSLLHHAWESGDTAVVAFSAWGGVGKSALVNRWLEEMKEKNFSGARLVYGWSFYSQGAGEDKQSSADLFFREILEWFDDPEPGKGSPVAKGRRLAELVRKNNALLVLDGLEPLQYPEGAIRGFDGKLKDDGIKFLLKELSACHQSRTCGQGMCVVTSRLPLTDLTDRTSSTRFFSSKQPLLGQSFQAVQLEYLPEAAGIKLLKSLKVNGMEADIQEVVKECWGHALTLKLLGNFLRERYDGDIRKRDLLPPMSRDDGPRACAWQVMEGYERRYEKEKSAELDVLRVMGLFDGPVDSGALGALKAEPVIPRVTERLQELQGEAWRGVLERLRNAGLLAFSGEQDGGNETLDCHPLVREYFGQYLLEQHPESWTSAHERLYQYYRTVPEKELPDTLEEMEPLLAAVAHGCKAGKYQEVLVEVYRKRIRRKSEHYINKKLGAFGSNLTAVSHFFTEPWGQPVAGLDDTWKAVVLNWAAFALRALGRLHEAVRPMEAAIKLSKVQEKWNEAARNTSNLSQLRLTLGQVSEAVAAARRSVEYADKSGAQFHMVSKRTTLANALHQAGHIDEAEKWFREAEEIQKDWQPEYPLLYSLPGFHYCDLLLGRGLDVKKRATKTLEWAMNHGGLLDIALVNLSLSWIAILTGETEPRARLDSAVEGLRKAGSQHHFPRGLLARAAYFRLHGNTASAWNDLIEAYEIAETGDMKLFLADCHLEAARLCLIENKIEDAEFHAEAAGELIKKTGYGRRKEELEEIKTQFTKLKSQTNPK